MRCATVCRFAQCAGCENSRNAVHDAVSRWVATRYVCFFCGSAFLLSPRRIFLFPATSSFGSSLLAHRLTTRNDIHPVQINSNMLTLRFLHKWTRLDRKSRRLYVIISGPRFFFGVIFEMSREHEYNFEQLRNYAMLADLQKTRHW